MGSQGILLSRIRRTRTTAATSLRCRPASKSSRLTLRSEEHTSELQSRLHLVCRLLLEKKKIAALPANAAALSAPGPYPRPAPCLRHLLGLVLLDPLIAAPYLSTTVIPRASRSCHEART